MTELMIVITELTKMQNFVPPVPSCSSALMVAVQNQATYAMGVVNVETIAMKHRFALVGIFV